MLSQPVSKGIPLFSTYWCHTALFSRHKHCKRCEDLRVVEDVDHYLKLPRPWQRPRLRHSLFTSSYVKGSSEPAQSTGSSHDHVASVGYSDVRLLGYPDRPPFAYLPFPSPPVYNTWWCLPASSWESPAGEAIVHVVDDEVLVHPLPTPAEAQQPQQPTTSKELTTIREARRRANEQTAQQPDN